MALQKLTLTGTQKTFVDGLLALAGMVLGVIVQNASLFPTIPAYVLPIVGAVGGYIISDLTTLVDTGTLPPTPTIEAQTLAALQSLLQNDPNLTATEKAVIQAAIAVLQNRLTPPVA